MQIEVIGPRTGKYTGNLLSAAPAMLEALKIAEAALEAYSGNESLDLATIRAAIAKAEGKQSVEV